MKKLVVLAALALLAGGWGSANAWAPGTKELQIDGGIDLDTLKAVREAVSDNPSVLRVNITSPGGAAVAGLAAARLLRKASDHGTTVEVHASGMCASACTWILAAGTPGYRYIDRYAFFLVHPLQKGGMFGPPVCVQREEGATETESRVMNALLEIARDLYMLFTGQDKATVDEWLTCGKEKIGDGRLAVEMKIADKVED